MSVSSATGAVCVLLSPAMQAVVEPCDCKTRFFPSHQLTERLRVTDEKWRAGVFVRDLRMTKPMSKHFRRMAATDGTMMYCGRLFLSCGLRRRNSDEISSSGLIVFENGGEFF